MKQKSALMSTLVASALAFTAPASAALGAGFFREHGTQCVASAVADSPQFAYGPLGIAYTNTAASAPARMDVVCNLGVGPDSGNGGALHNITVKVIDVTGSVKCTAHQSNAAGSGLWSQTLQSSGGNASAQTLSFTTVLRDALTFVRCSIPRPFSGKTSSVVSLSGF